MQITLHLHTYSFTRAIRSINVITCPPLWWRTISVSLFSLLLFSVFPSSSHALTPTPIPNQIAACPDASPFDPTGKTAGIAANQQIFHNAEWFTASVNAVKDAKIPLVRRAVNWSMLEPTPGEYLWDEPLKGTGKHDSFISSLDPHSVLLVLNEVPPWASTGTGDKASHYPPQLDKWKEFITEAVTRYHSSDSTIGKVKHWEIWNEPDVNGSFEGTAQDYVEILNLSYDTIKAIDPDAVVWAPVVAIGQYTLVKDASNQWGYRAPNPSEWEKYEKHWEILFEVLKHGKFDGIAFHTYGDNIQTYNVTRTVRHELDKADFENIPLMISETNYRGPFWGVCPYSPPPDPYYFTENQQKQILKSRYACLFNAGADSVMWFTIQDSWDWQKACDQDDTNRNGILRKLDASRKPSYYGLKEIIDSILLTPTITPSPTTTPSPSSSPTQTSKTGDFDKDGDIDYIDLITLLGSYGSDNAQVDLNQNGKVDVFDFNIMISNIF